MKQLLYAKPLMPWIILSIIIEKQEVMLSKEKGADYNN